MAGFLPGHDSLERAIATTTEAVLGRPPARVLDLGGGPGRFAERLSTRWPAARITLLDLDPVLLALARAALPHSVSVIGADLTCPSWPSATGAGYDLVTAVMAVHYLDAAPIRDLYRRARDILAPGGLLVIADVMPDDGLPSAMNALIPPAGSAPGSAVGSAAGAAAGAAAGSAAGAAAGAADAWSRWWAALRESPSLRPLLTERAELFRDRPPAEFTAGVAWHAVAAREAGFGECGLIWREARHAALAALT